jgi:hypothetical protein
MDRIGSKLSHVRETRTVSSTENIHRLQSMAFTSTRSDVLRVPAVSVLSSNDQQAAGALSPTAAEAATTCNEKLVSEGMFAGIEWTEQNTQYRIREKRELHWRGEDDATKILER